MSEKNGLTPPLPHWLTVAFSGHRRLDDPGAVRAAIAREIDALAKSYPVMAGVCSAAAGADLLFAEEMLRRNHPLFVTLPFPVERFKKDFEGFPPEEWQRAQEVMRRATDLDIVHVAANDHREAEHCAGGKCADPGDTDAYMEAATPAIERAHVLIAVWDGKPGSGPGGTHDAVKYAGSLGRHVIVIPIAGEPVAYNPGRLTGAEFAPSVAMDFGTPSYDQIKAHFDANDTEAERIAPDTRRRMKVYLMLHLVASALVASVAVFNLGESGGAHGAHEAAGGLNWKYWLALAISALDVGVLTFAQFSHKKLEEGREKWFPLRVGAEICRSFRATWHIRRHVAVRQPAHPPIKGGADLYNTLRIMRHMGPQAGPVLDLPAAKEDYARERVRDQINYFSRKQRLAALEYGNLKKFMHGASLLTIICSMVVLILSTSDLMPRTKMWAEFGGMAFPLAVTTAGLWLITGEAARRRVRYAEMISALEKLEPRVLNAPTWDSLARAAAEVEGLLVQEVAEWLSYARFTRDVH